ncbi:MAG: TlpA disulfide reductase family protein [Planctomycetota bacterium]
MNRFVSFACLTALSLAVIEAPWLTNSVRAEDAPAKSAPITEESVTVPDGTPAELVEFIEKTARQRPDPNLSQEDAMKTRIFTIKKAADKILANPDANDEQKETASGAKLSMLFSGWRMDPENYKKPLESFADELLKENPKSKSAPLAAAMKLLVGDMDVSIPSEEVFAKLAKYREDYPESPLGVQLFAMYANELSSSQEFKRALAAYDKGIELYKDSPNVRFLEETSAGLRKKVELVGKPLAIAGPTLDGSEFDLSKLKGKVVLVDFWATWCGPCVGEMPHVKKVYDKLHEKGFEVVGVSLDETDEALRGFVKENEVPWTQVIFSKEDDRGWNNPLAKKLGINSIPATFLIDQEGNVVSFDLRGEKPLEKAVERLLNKPTAPLAN